MGSGVMKGMDENRNVLPVTINSDGAIMQHGAGFELIASETGGVAVGASAVTVLEVPNSHLYRDMVFIAQNAGAAGLDTIERLILGYQPPYNPATYNYPSIDTGLTIAIGGAYINSIPMGTIYAVPDGVWPFPNLFIRAKSNNDGTGDALVKAWVYGRRI